MSGFLIKPNLQLNLLKPYAANEPSITAKADALADIKAVLKKRARNSSLGLDSTNIVSGENPRLRQPFQEGSKSIQGISNPGVTLAAVLNEVVAVQ